MTATGVAVNDELEIVDVGTIRPVTRALKGVTEEFGGAVKFSKDVEFRDVVEFRSSVVFKERVELLRSRGKVELRGIVELLKVEFPGRSDVTLARPTLTHCCANPVFRQIFRQRSSRGELE